MNLKKLSRIADSSQSVDEHSLSNLSAMLDKALVSVRDLSAVKFNWFGTTLWVLPWQNDEKSEKFIVVKWPNDSKDSTPYGPGWDYIEVPWSSSSENIARHLFDRFSIPVKDDAVAVETFNIEFELNSLLAEELQAAYDYLKVAPFISGKEGQSVRDEFFKHYEEEMDHAEKLIDRLSVLGLVCQVTSLCSIPNFTQLSPTPSSTDLVSACAVNYDAESAAIAHYTRVIQQLGDSDPVTVDILKEILADEQEHLSDLSDFIKDNQGTI